MHVSPAKEMLNGKGLSGSSSVLLSKANLSHQACGCVPPLIFLIGGCSQLASLRAHNFVYAAKGYAGHFCLWTTHSEVAFWSKTQVLHVSKNLLSSTLAAFAAGSVVFLVGAMDSSHALASG